MYSDHVRVAYCDDRAILRQSPDGQPLLITLHILITTFSIFPYEITMISRHSSSEHQHAWYHILPSTAIYAVMDLVSHPRNDPPQHQLQHNR